ncbi:MAG: transglycosylase SLT domain-containing protein [Mariprofundaceae bacterium]|nr:transglycosylase SLT domain-containing protein [Mariprofundaceae bacterium]
MTTHHNIKNIFLRLFWLIVLCGFFPQWAGATLSTQQETFKQARAALKANQLETFNRLYDQLKDYPLHPYLDVWRYWNVLDNPRYDAKVERILIAFSAIPESVDLRVRWIKALAKRGQWQLVAAQIKKLPKGKHPDQRITLLSLWHNGQKSKAVAAYTAYWRKITGTDTRLLPLEKRWQKKGHPTADDIWARVNKQAKRGRWSNAKKAAKPLAKHQRAWLDYWQKVKKNPARWLKSPPSRDISMAQMAKIMDDGLRQLAKKDVIRSWSVFHQILKPRLRAPHIGILMRHIGLRAAYQHKIEAIAWLTQLPPIMRTDISSTWAARLLLLNHRWPEALTAINALPRRIKNKEKDRWLYWKARCLGAMGDSKSAMVLYRQMAFGRGYYSFLSAERSHQPYKINAKSAPANPAAIKLVNAMPGLKRAKEWLQMNERGKATREWSQALRGSSKATWYAAMMLAKTWQWPEKALRAASKAGAYNHLVVRFPLAFYDDVIAASKKTGLSTSFLWSVMRQESLFDPSAKSYVGASGLMQLMPKTASAVAKHYPHLGKTPNLKDPKTNITLGSWYLNHAMKRFDHRQPLAAAAYNAGPHRVSQWLKQTPFTDADIWVEAIPFNETRNYVQRIMGYSIIYDWRLGHKPVSLLKRLKGEL